MRLFAIEDGSVLIWGAPECGVFGVSEDEPAVRTPSRLRPRDLCGRKVVQIACGHHHIACITGTTVIVRVTTHIDVIFRLTEDGDIVTWGRNHYGQLGLGADSVDVQETPTLVPRPSGGEGYVQVSCGQHHTVAVTCTCNVVS